MFFNKFGNGRHDYIPLLLFIIAYRNDTILNHKLVGLRRSFASTSDIQTINYTGGSHNEYDWKIEIYRSGISSVDYTCDPSNDDDLNDYKMESFSEDIILTPTPTPTITPTSTPTSTPTPAPPPPPRNVDDGISGWSNDNTPIFTWQEPPDPTGIIGYYYAVDDSTPETGGSWTYDTYCDLLAQSEGEHRFYVVAKNGANLTGPPGSHLFRIDTIDPDIPQPQIQWLDQGLGSGNGQIVEVTCAMPSGAVELRYTMSGGGATSSNWITQTTYRDTGVHDEQYVYCTVEARDEAGNVSTSTQVRSEYIEDRTAPPNPQPQITWQNQGLNSGDTQVVIVNCALPGDAVSLKYDMTGGGTDDSGWTSQISYTDTGVHDDQTVSCTVTAKDSIGNSSTGSDSFDISDRTAPPAPQPQIAWQDQDLNSGDTQIIIVHCALPGDAVLLQYDMSGDGTDDSGWISQIDYTDDGVHDAQTVSCTVTAKDSEGNYSTGSDSFDIPDRTAPPNPQPQIAWQDQGANSADAQVVVVTCPLPGDAVLLQYDMSGDGTDDSGWISQTDYTDDGVHDDQTLSCTVTAKDSEGNSSTGTDDFTIPDRTAPPNPQPQITWEDQGLNSQDTQIIVVTCEITGDAVELYYDMTGGGTDDFGYTTQTSYTDSDVGDEQTVGCEVIQRDAEQNYASAYVEIEVGDRTPPVLPTIDDPGVITQDDPLAASISPYDVTGTKSGDTATIWVNGDFEASSFLSETTWVYPLVVDDGDNPVSVVAKDAVGNYSDPVPATLVVDIVDWYVDDDVAERVDGYPRDGFTEDTAFRTIEEAHAWVDTGDVVNVLTGTYREQVVMVADTMVSGEGREDVVIDGYGWGDTVVAASRAALERVTVSGSGHREDDFGVDAGGTDGFTLSECTVSDNFDGVGLIGCTGVVVKNNIIAGNVRDGVAIYDGDGVIESNIESNTIVGNWGAGIFGDLAASYVVKNNIIVQNNTGIEVFWGAPQVVNYNNLRDNHEGDYKNCTAGANDISVEPLFEDAQGGNYHLRVHSPCIDAGDPASDYSNEPAQNGGRINLGAYGNTTEATETIAGIFGDSDSDGMPNWYEGEEGLAENDAADGGGVRQFVLDYMTVHGIGQPSGFDPANYPPVGVLDGVNDPDSDNLSNLEEYLLGTDPHNGDGDGDDLPDGWEVEHELDPWDMKSAWEDADGDGASNYEEYVAGTDPNDDTESFTITGVDRGTPDSVTVTWGSVTGALYDIYFSNEPVSDHMGWTSAVDDYPSGGTTTSWVDDGTSTGTPPTDARHYKIVYEGSSVAAVEDAVRDGWSTMSNSAHAISAGHQNMGGDKREGVRFKPVLDSVGDVSHEKMQGAQFMVWSGVVAAVSLDTTMPDEVVDSDGDGMSDDWETAHGLDPHSPWGNDGATGDRDYDGTSNWEEYVANTDPDDESSVFEIESVDRTDPATVTITWASVPGMFYDIYFSDNPVSDGMEWLLVKGPYAARDDPHTTTSWTDDGSLTGSAPTDGRHYLVTINAQDNPYAASRDAAPWHIMSGTRFSVYNPSLNMGGEGRAGTQFKLCDLVGDTAAGTAGCFTRGLEGGSLASRLSDVDGDGILDSDEINRYRTDPGKWDTDGDGMPDGWEAQYYLDPNDPTDRDLDPDNDGDSNIEEYLMGTNPKDGIPTPTVTPTGTPLPTATSTPTRTQSPSPTPSATVTPTATPGPVYVDLANTTGVEDGTLEHPYTTITAALDAAIAGDVVTIIGSGTYDVSLNQEQFPLVLKEGVGIEAARGCKAVLDGEASSQILSAQNVTGVTLKNIVLQGGAGDNGAGIGCSGSEVVLSNLLVTGCSALVNGGATYFFQSTVEMFNVTIDNSDAVAGGGVYCEDSELTVSDCIIVNSVAGEGVYVEDATSVVTVAHCDVWNNAGGEYGGLLGDQTGVNGNISLDPLFTQDNGDEYYLSQVNAGQPDDSPCVDAGSVPVSGMPLEKYTTRTDGETDTGMLDMGFHYHPRYAIDIVTGWNFIALPFYAQGRNAAGLVQELNDQGAQVSHIARFFNGGWQIHQPGLPFNNFTLALDEGYMVRSEGSTSGLTVAGSYIEEKMTLDLGIGWSAINLNAYELGGTTITNASELATWIEQEGYTISHLAHWDVGGWKIYQKGLPFNNFTVENANGVFPYAYFCRIEPPKDTGEADQEEKVKLPPVKTPESITATPTSTPVPSPTPTPPITPTPTPPFAEVYKEEVVGLGLFVRETSVREGNFPGPVLKWSILPGLPEYEGDIIAGVVMPGGAVMVFKSGMDGVKEFTGIAGAARIAFGVPLDLTQTGELLIPIINIPKGEYRFIAAVMRVGSDEVVQVVESNSFTVD